MRIWHGGDHRGPGPGPSQLVGRPQQTEMMSTLPGGEDEAANDLLHKDVHKGRPHPAVS